MDIMTPWRRRALGRRRAFTLTEVLVASVIGLAVAGFAAYVSLFSAKAQAILMPQMARQTAANRSLQAVSDMLRNAYFDTVEVPSDTRIEFESPTLPANQIARVDFAGGILRYFPNRDSQAGSRILARGLEEVTFEFNIADKLVILHAVFKYRKYRGYGRTEAEQLNGTFTTKIWPRN